MPIIIPKELPAYQNLTNEKIFIMDKERAGSQDIRPIEIAILNLMPTKVETETQLLRLLGNSPLQVNITFINTASYKSTHVSDDHMRKFYKSLSTVKKMKFDGMIVTGAPVETLEFEDVKYWSELEDIMDFAENSVTSTLYICWGAQAALYHKFGIKKENLEKKLFGIFPTRAVVENDMLLKGMDDTFYIPQSRHTRIDESALRANPNVKILAESEIAGISVAKTHDNKSFFFTGHSEYDRYTLKREYERDIAKGMDIEKPYNYFNDKGEVDMKWKSTANLLYYNWLNYYVYQVTPFDIQHVAAKA
jgi:homoserine O-succinyltransferase